MIERVPLPPDPRLAPMAKLAEITRCPHDAAERDFRKSLRRADIKRALK